MKGAKSEEEKNRIIPTTSLKLKEGFLRKLYKKT